MLQFSVCALYPDFYKNSSFEQKVLLTFFALIIISVGGLLTFANKEVTNNFIISHDDLLVEAFEDGMITSMMDYTTQKDLLENKETAYPHPLPEKTTPVETKDSAENVAILPRAHKSVLRHMANRLFASPPKTPSTPVEEKKPYLDKNGNRFINFTAHEAKYTAILPYACLPQGREGDAICQAFEHGFMRSGMTHSIIRNRPVGFKIKTPFNRRFCSTPAKELTQKELDELGIVLPSDSERRCIVFDHTKKH